MALTKAEKDKLRSLDKRARKIEHDARKLVKDVGSELVRQMRRS